MGYRKVWNMRAKVAGGKEVEKVVGNLLNDKNDQIFPTTTVDNQSGCN